MVCGLPPVVRGKNHWSVQTAHSPSSIFCELRLLLFHLKYHKFTFNLFGVSLCLYNRWKGPLDCEQRFCSSEFSKLPQHVYVRLVITDVLLQTPTCHYILKVFLTFIFTVGHHTNEWLRCRQTTQRFMEKPDINIFSRTVKRRKSSIPSSHWQQHEQHFACMGRSERYVLTATPPERDIRA